MVNEENYHFGDNPTWWLRRITPLFNSQNKIYRLISTSLDITDRKLFELELYKFNEAIKQSPLLILITNPKGIIEYANPKISEITGYTDKELIGNRVSKLKSGVHDNKFYAELWSTVLSGEIWKGVIVNKNKFGSEYHVDSIIKPVIVDNKIISFIQIGQDITDIIKKNEELKSAKNKAEQSDKLKSAFLANMSHEIRTPINSILGFSHLLKYDDISDEEKKQFVERISSQVLYLLSLINDIIDISKIEAGIMDVNYEDVNLKELILDVFYSIPQTSKKETVEIKLSKDAEEQEIFTKTDPTRLKQIILNLVNNSLKFTLEGEIEFGYRIGNPNDVNFYVRDTGVGIPAEKIKNVFDRFSQITHKGLKNKQQGTGLGLAISKALVELLNGQIFVKSVENEGTEFSFNIPLIGTNKLPVFKKQKVESNSISLEGIKILIAEDLEDNFDTLNLLLGKKGAVINRAVNGKEAIEKVKDEIYDFVLMDINMPVMNGLIATKKIRKFNGEIPIIAVTAYAMENDKVKAFKNGFSAYISKPIDFEKLLQILGELKND